MTSRSSFISAPPVNSAQYRQETMAYFQYLIDQFLDNEGIYDLADIDGECPHLVAGLSDGMSGDLPF